MVFQDPYASLNSRMSAGDIIAEPWRTRKMCTPAGAIEGAVRELLDLVGPEPPATTRGFSGGQRQRIGIARALALNPDVIICDEPVSALDLSVQAQVLNLLNDLQQQLGISYIFISHDLSVVRHVADRVAVMYLGRIIETGPTEAVYDRANHPYAALMSAAPKLDAAQRRQDTAQGRSTVAAQSALGLPVPDPVLEGHRGLRDAGATGRRRSTGQRSQCRMPSPAAGRTGWRGVGLGVSVSSIIAAAITWRRACRRRSVRHGHAGRSIVAIDQV